MALLQEYTRPGSVDEALALLAQNQGRLVPLAGGTLLVGQLETRALADVDGVVDLRDCGLDAIREDGGTVHVGSMCTLAVVAEHPIPRELADGLIVRAARGEGPVNLCNAATVGGVIACAEYDSEFYAALLALNADVIARTLHGIERTVPLAAFDATGMLITGVSIALGKLRGGAARVARTPSDRPIVAAYAVAEDGSSQEARVALCGVGVRPVLAGAPLMPPDDFKGGSEYRRAMADVVTRRALAEMEEANVNAD